MRIKPAKRLHIPESMTGNKKSYWEDIVEPGPGVPGDLLLSKGILGKYHF